MDEIFLSASIPLAGRKYFEGSNPVMIHGAVRAFANLVLGGHPSITPMLWASCENLGVEYAAAVTLYQSRFFEEQFPEENARFRNVVYTDKRASREESLTLMRRAMLSREGLRSAVFIGGMEGVEAEFGIFRELHPNQPTVFVGLPGGAAAALAPNDSEGARSSNFTKLFVRELGIDPSESRHSIRGE
jgi:hypothetical protein